MPTTERQQRQVQLIDASEPVNSLTAITTLDGRYRRDKRYTDRLTEVASYTSEFNLIRTRLEVEAAFLLDLSSVGIVRQFTPEETERLENLGLQMSQDDAARVKKIEDETRHDVKALEKAFGFMVEGTSLADVSEKVHYAITSEDTNNLAYRLMLKRVTDNVSIPLLDGVVDSLLVFAEEYADTPMLARTHGQSAVPTTVGKEFVNPADRLNKEIRQLAQMQLTGKLTGAVGNLNALQQAHPDVDWIAFGDAFVESFGFTPNHTTTQINPYDDIAAYFHNYTRINTILHGLDQDMWRYISDHWMVQEVKKGETGSSTMAQKVNPIYFENSEGNLEKANAFFLMLANNLCESRLQRDLSDSTLIRELGLPIGFSVVAYVSTLEGLSRIQPNTKAIASALNQDWTILGEPLQVILRREGVKNAYDLILERTRGVHMGEKEWFAMIDELPVDDVLKKELKQITPESYLGLAPKLTRAAIASIRSSRK